MQALRDLVQALRADERRQLWLIVVGLALAALKHSLPGDAALFRQGDLDAYLAGGLDVRR